LAIIIYHESRTVVHTSHHIEETDAGLDRPLYLRNKLYDKTLKSQNYYSNIVLFPGVALFHETRRNLAIIIVKCVTKMYQIAKLLKDLLAAA